MEIVLLVLVCINLVFTSVLFFALVFDIIKSHVSDELDNCNYYGEDRL